LNPINGAELASIWAAAEWMRGEQNQNLPL